MWEFIKGGGPVMALLAMTSLVGLAFILERGWALRWNRVLPPMIIDRMEQWKSGEVSLEKLVEPCRPRGSTLGRLILGAADHAQWTRQENTDGLQTRARQEVIQLERGLVVLEVVVGVAPLLGLIGTIHGLIRLFGGIGDLGNADGAVLAEGISMALNTTMAGLLIAIPSLVAWSYYSKKVEAMAVELEGICGDFMRRLYRSSEPD